MIKRALILFLSSVLLLSFLVSCQPPFDPEYKNRVKFISEDETYYLEYSNAKYLPHHEEIISVEELDDDDVFLGWGGSWWGYNNVYYSYTEVNPLFIYEARTDILYLREDYDFQTDHFKIDDSNSEISFADEMTSVEKFDLDKKMVSFDTDIVLYSKTYSQLEINLNVFLYEDTWYASTERRGLLYIVSEEFINILFDNNIISSQFIDLR